MQEAGLALSVFWGIVSAGRAPLTLIAAQISPYALYRASPFVVGISFFALPSPNEALPSILGLGLAGLALSFFFPISASLASAEEPELAATASGAMRGARPGDSVSNLSAALLVMAVIVVFPLSAMVGVATRPNSD